MAIAVWDKGEAPNDVTYARGRFVDRTYLTKPFVLQFSADAGQPARYAIKVFDLFEPEEPGEEWEWVDDVIYESPGGRVQIKAMVAREKGAVRKVQFQRVPTGADATDLEPLFELDRDSSAKLLQFFRSLEAVSVDGDESSVRVDDELITDLFRDPEAISSLYSKDPERFRDLIELDVDASDVFALAHRQAVATTMRTWMDDDAVFAAAAADAGGPERAWQGLFEENPWILGVGLGGQLLTSWDPGRLEREVSGQTVESPGKRIDAFMRTQGSVNSIVLAEIKHHKTDLLGIEYRSECWAISREMSGAVVQAQQTAYLATRSLSEQLRDLAPDGSQLPSESFIIRPRTYLIAGSLDEMRGEGGGVHAPKFRSFELFRRSLGEPEILTFDEVLARVEWQVSRLTADAAHEDAN